MIGEIRSSGRTSFMITVITIVAAFILIVSWDTKADLR